MTATLAPPRGVPAEPEEQPHDLRIKPSLPDRIFNALLATSGGTVLALLIAIVIFLFIGGFAALHRAGFGLFTDPTWAPPTHFWIVPLLVGSIVIAVIAVAVATPVSLCTALMINEYAPRSLKPFLTGVIDLLATVPSIVYGFWGLLLISPKQESIARFVAEHFGFVPFLRTPSAGQYVQSIMVCGIVCAVTIIPIITSVTREVMAQAPRDVCEAALGLGGTRWGMVTDVILPFSRNGILGAVLLGFGRGLGETMIPLLILSSQNKLTLSTLGPNGLGSIAQQIAATFVSASDPIKSAFIMLALVLFIATLIISTGARRILTSAAKV
jgi:phosphate transport system permease protein